MNIYFLRLLGAIAIMLLAWPRPTDANAPAGHYVVTAGVGVGNGTVYDTKSKLTWQQTASSARYPWATAKNYCTSAEVTESLGGAGWRLPTIRELQSIVDLSQTSGPFVDRNAFPSTPDRTWSASVVAGSPSWVWGVSFSDGNAAIFDKSQWGYVRCVR